jgi:hypothetical protein
MMHGWKMHVWGDVRLEGARRDMHAWKVHVGEMRAWQMYAWGMHA